MSNLRQQILDASAAIVAKKGVRALSFREVARRARVSHQAPYHHFANHHAILRALAQEGFDGLARAMDAASAKFKNEPLKALTASGVAYVEFAEGHLGHFRVMFQNSLIRENRKSERLSEAETAHGVLLRLAKAARESGVAPHMTSEGLALLCWSTAHGIAALITEKVLNEKNGKLKEDSGAMVLNALHALLAVR